MKPKISSYLCYTSTFFISPAFFIKGVRSSSVAGQETLIGIAGRDFIILGADSSVSSSISLTSSNVDKIRVIVDPFPHGKGYGHGSGQGRDDEENMRGIDEQQQVIAVASAGDAADSERLLGHLVFHASSMEYQHLGCDVKCIYHGDLKGTNTSPTGTPSWLSSPAGLDAESVAFLARGLIASSLRSRGQLKTCLLVAGMIRCYQNPNDQKKTDSGNASANINTSAGMGDELQCFNSDSDTSPFAQRIQDQVRAATESYNYDNGNSKTQNAFNCNDRGGEFTHKEDSSLNSGEGEKNNNHIKSTILKPRLFWLDEYGSLQSVEYGVHGLASNFALSILDRKYNPNLSREEAADLVADCFRQLRKRFVINSPELPCIKCIDSDGCNVIAVPPIHK